MDRGYRDAGLMRTAPTLEPLRDDPRFRSTLARADSLLAAERRRVEREGWGEPSEAGPSD